MKEDVFFWQMDRLKTQWPNSYGVERSKVIWEAMRNQPDQIFSRAITRCLQTLRAAPMLPELLKAIEEIGIEDKNADRDRCLTDGSVRGVLESAKDNNRRADPEFVKTCMKLLDDKTKGKITMKQFLEGCDMLDHAARRMG